MCLMKCAIVTLKKSNIIQDQNIFIKTLYHQYSIFNLIYFYAFLKYL